MAYRTGRLLLLPALAIFLQSLCALALPASKIYPAQVRFGAIVIGPFAFTHFCVRYKAECFANSGTPQTPVKLTPDRFRELLTVNAFVNRMIEPRKYQADTTFDTWRIAPKTGDCNDFAVTKRHQLLALGWPSRSLLLAEVVTAIGERHLVLLVRTENTDLVLDNLNANVKIWSRTPYKWLRLQSPSDPPLWVKIKSESVS